MSAQKRSDVISQLHTFREIRDEWRAIVAIPDPDQPSLTVEPSLFRFENGQPTIKGINEDIARGIQSLNKYAAESEFAHDAYGLVLKLDVMLDIWDEWAYEVKQAPPGATNHLSRPDAPAGWEAFEIVLKAIPVFQYRIPEPIEELASQPGIRDNQIAETYGWYTSTGAPDTDKVQQERRLPGTHYDPMKWVSPEIKRSLERDISAWEKRIPREHDPRLYQDYTPDIIAEEWVEPESPESIQELLRLPHMTLAQVADMKGLTIDQVREISSRGKIATDYASAVDIMPELAEDVRNQTATLETINEKIDKMFDEENANINTHPEKGDVSSQILAIRKENPDIAPEDVYRLLRQQYPVLEMDVVYAVIDGVDSATETTTGHPDLETVDEASRSDLFAMAKKWDIVGIKGAKSSDLRDQIKERIKASA